MMSIRLACHVYTFSFCIKIQNHKFKTVNFDPPLPKKKKKKKIRQTIIIGIRQVKTCMVRSNSPQSSHLYIVVVMSTPQPHDCICLHYLSVNCLPYSSFVDPKHENILGSLVPDAVIFGVSSKLCFAIKKIKFLGGLKLTDVKGNSSRASFGRVKTRPCGRCSNLSDRRAIEVYVWQTF